MPENVPFLSFRENQQPNALAMYYFLLKQKCEDYNSIIILNYNSFVKILYYLSCKVVIFGVRFYDNKVVKLDFQTFSSTEKVCKQLIIIMFIYIYF